MHVNEYIHRHGFKRWYERQLIESYAYLALGFFALILLLSGAEMMASAKSGTGYVAILLVASFGGVLTLVAWRRFRVLLGRAEHFAEAATCPGCQLWGKFRVVRQEAEDDDDPPESGRPRWLRVRCSKCAREWRI